MIQDEKFNALIKLLDDDDPRVASQVEGELFSLGTAGIGMLEKAWETTSDSLVQQRIEELIKRIQITHFTKEMRDWRMAGGRDMLEGWLILTQVQYPTLNVQKYRNEINRLVNRIWLQTNSAMNDLEKLMVVNRLLYQQERYSGNYQEAERPENNYFSFVIDTKLGNSLSLAVLYYIVCQHLEIQLQVVNFNGYFALRYYQQKSHFYIDAYNKGMFFTPEQVEQFLKKLKAEPNVYHYKPLSNIYMALQFISTLDELHAKAGNADKSQAYRQLHKDIEIHFGDEAKDS